MNKRVLIVLLFGFILIVGRVHANEHVLIGVTKNGYLFKNTGEILDENQLRNKASQTKVDRVTLIVDKCIDSSQTVKAFVALNGLGIGMISIQINPKQKVLTCDGT